MRLPDTSWNISEVSDTFEIVPASLYINAPHSATSLRSTSAPDLASDHSLGPTCFGRVLDVVICGRRSNRGETHKKVTNILMLVNGVTGQPEFAAGPLPPEGSEPEPGISPPTAPFWSLFLSLLN
jgi:hypothetical protein